MRLRVVAICATIFMWLAHIAAAEQVTLRFPDGSFEVSGPLLGFDGQSYRVDTRFGVLTIAAQGVLCAGDCPDAARVPRIRIAGTPALAEVLIPALIDSFAASLGLSSKEHRQEEGLALTLIAPEIGPVARFEVTAMTTTAGLQSLLDGQADIALADRPAASEEAERFRAAGLGDLSDPLRSRLVARRPLRLVVPPSQAVSAVTVPQMLRLTSGQVVSWSELGGAPDPVAVHLLDEEAEQVAARLRAIAAINGEGADLGPVTRHPDIQSLVSGLSADPGALAITHQTLFSARVLPVQVGCTSSPRAALDPYRDESDPLMARMWTYTAAPRLPDIGRAFLVYMTGPAAQPVIDRAGFVDKRPSPIALNDQGDRLVRAILTAQEGAGFADLAEAIAALAGHDRLSTVFRFREGTAKLDPSAQSAVQSLAAFLDAGRFDGGELLFVGFSDGIGAADVNRTLSEERAVVVRDAVRDLMATNPERAVFAAKGLGEVMPIACDNTPWGRHTNRRVEVWFAPQR